jgi:hypothetical protein
MKIKHCLLFLLSLVVATLVVPGRSVAGDVDPEDLLQVLRADMRADKVAIVTDAMAFKAGEGEKFWPVYRKYEAELITLNDERLKLMQDYAAKFDTLTDADAKVMAEKFFDWQTRRNELRKKYFTEIAKVTSNLEAFKFFQVEHRLDLLVDLQLAAQLPGLFLKSVQSSNQ